MKIEEITEEEAAALTETTVSEAASVKAAPVIEVREEQQAVEKKPEPEVINMVDPAQKKGE